MFELVYVYLFVIETKGLSLEETAALFDGEDARDQLAVNALHAAAAAPDSPSVDEKLEHDYADKA